MKPVNEKQMSSEVSTQSQRREAAREADVYKSACHREPTGSSNSRNESLLFDGSDRWITDKVGV
jgi:hypothetical protein